MYLFPEIMFERLILARTDVRQKTAQDIKDLLAASDDTLGDDNLNLKKAYQALPEYRKKCREYFGLGFLFSFIRSTPAYNARQTLFAVLDAYVYPIIKVRTQNTFLQSN